MQKDTYKSGHWMDCTCCAGRGEHQEVFTEPLTGAEQHRQFEEHYLCTVCLEGKVWLYSGFEEEQKYCRDCLKCPFFNLPNN